MIMYYFSCYEVRNQTAKFILFADVNYYELTLILQYGTELLYQEAAARESQHHLHSPLHRYSVPSI